VNVSPLSLEERSGVRTVVQPNHVMNYKTAGTTKTVAPAAVCENLLNTTSATLNAKRLEIHMKLDQKRTALLTLDHQWELVVFTNP
jgi:hypothetical protein